MKSFRLLLALLLPALLLIGLPQSLRLVKIAKSAPNLEGILQALSIDIVQELETCYLAHLEKDDLLLLKRHSVRFSVLDSDSGSKEYFLIPQIPSGLLGRLTQTGHVLKIEDGAFLFWDDRDGHLALLPPDLERKPLPRVPVPSRKATPANLGGLGFQLRVNDVIQTIVSEVNRDNLRSYVQSLQDFQTRYTTTSNCVLAAQFLLNYFQTVGLDAWLQPFIFGSNSSQNVVAELKGTTNPGDIVIICAHYDSTSNQPAILAPGADDNASGTAAVMEAARILAKYPFDFTVRFIAFSAEEQGLYGSRAYSAGALAESQRIVAVINLDMIAYADKMPEDLDIIVNSQSQWLAERASLAAETYTGLAVRKSLNAAFIYSDHSPFWDRGFAALCGIEDESIINPYYHKTTDTIDTLNFDFYESATETALAALADLAQPVRPGYPQAPRSLTAQPSTYYSLFNAVRNVSLTWQSSADAVGYKVHRSEVSRLGYEKINSVLVTTTSYTDRALSAETSYYYAVTAVGPGGLESNFSQEVPVTGESPRLGSPFMDNKTTSFQWGWR
jgi:hypothetical protein